MGHRYKKKEGLGIVVFTGLPGLGHDDAVVEGEEYARFCPSVLVKVKDEVTEQKQKVEVADHLSSEVKQVKQKKEEPEDQEGPSMKWGKPRLQEYALALGIALDDDAKGMPKTKRMLLEEIQAKEG